MRTNIMLFFISLAFITSATTITKVKKITPKNLDLLTFSHWEYNNTLINIYSPGLRSGYEKVDGSADYYIHRGYLEFDLQDLGFEKYANITEASINLKADLNLETYDSTVKDTINLKTIVDGVLSDYLFPKVWNTLNNGMTLSDFEISSQQTKVISNPTIKDYVNSRIGDFVGFALINQSEETKGMSFYNGTNDLYLQINYTIESPATPNNLKTSSISKTGCTLSWEDGGRSDTYTIYINGSQYDSGLTATTYSVNGLTAGTIYNINVIAKNDAGVSNSASTTVCTLPNPPISPLCYSMYEGSIMSTWTAPTGIITGYRVYICPENIAFDFQASLTTATNAIISGLSLQAYKVKVCSYNQTGESGKVVATPPTLNAPSNFRAWSPATGVNLLLWDYSGTQHLKFRIFNRSNNSTIAIVNKDQRSYMLTGLSTNITYIFGIDAFNMVTRSYSPTTGLQILRSATTEDYSQILDNSIDIFTDASNNLLFIKGINTLYNVKIFNLQGKNINSEKDCDNVMDISNLKAGIYILKIESGTNEITKKFLKQ